MTEQQELEIKRSAFKLKLHERAYGAGLFEEIKEELFRQLGFRDAMTPSDPAYLFTAREIHRLEQHLIYKGIVEQRPKDEYGYPIKCLYSIADVVEEDTFYVGFSVAGRSRMEDNVIIDAIRAKHHGLSWRAPLEFIRLSAGKEDG